MVVEEMVKETKKPVVKSDIIKALQNLGIENVELLLVYADLSKFDYIIGGAQTVIEAIYEVAGFQATIVMPCHRLSDACPTFFDNALPSKWQSLIKKQTPAFDINLSPIYSGEVAETFAKLPNVHRSEHPVASFIAAGRKADWYMKNHHLNSMFGEGSPLQKLYAQDAKVLCLGTAYEHLTALHLAHYFANSCPMIKHEAVVLECGKRTLVEYEDLALDSALFSNIGEAYEQTIPTQKIEIGNSLFQLHDFRTLINFSTDYLLKSMI